MTDGWERSPDAGTCEKTGCEDRARWRHSAANDILPVFCDYHMTQARAANERGCAYAPYAAKPDRRDASGRRMTVWEVARL